MNIPASAALLLIFSPLTAFNVIAETAEEQGLAIAVEADRRENGFSDSTADMTMELRNQQGDTSVREIRVKTLEVANDGDKSLSIFDQPADIKGTAFLTFSHALEPDDQWLYLPSLKRVKRINSKNKSGPFMGSEFSYEDIASQEVAKYTYKYLRDETLNGIDCYVIERYPAYEHSGYTRQVGWINKAEYRPEKIVFYDRKNSLLKTLTYSGYKKYLDQYWRADQMLMENHQNGKSTLMTWKNYQFQTGLDESDFNHNSLKRAK
ncbi:MAG: outer membrane lipoprotein-sorting protein [Gammaproteobacteria bacterium]|jgi:outer membrane lipoprotein-sorting protein|nr:outer membrane lipoprotein-sorting protein [Gammaproteobacteria bacterium]